MAAPNDQPDYDDEPPLDPAAERVRRRLMRFMIVNLGILFAALMAVVLALVYRSISPEEATPPDMVGQLAPSAETFSETIELPAGARILSHSAVGNRLSLHLRLQDGTEAIHFYDINGARPLGSFKIVQGQD
ncbi:fimbrial protein [Chelativorans sp. Marseille-P2723]|uniref:fimbrial protein n=1 Tax=Chelativorans sp. Marseille-P2723 TaxID=2709133 RepID=UPI0015715F42|nr:fimbrial protein [Chelativorans sp. Marseille-P2723]